MRTKLLALCLLSSSLSFSQKAITNEISSELRFGAGIVSSRVYGLPVKYESLTFPMVTLYYAPVIYNRFEIQTGIGADARGGKTVSPVAKFRSYNVNGLLAFRIKMKDLKLGLGANPLYFIDTRKTVLEGSLSSGVVHIPVRHFRRTDFPLFFTAEMKVHEKFSLEARFTNSYDVFKNKEIAKFWSVSLSANYLLAYRYKRVPISEK